MKSTACVVLGHFHPFADGETGESPDNRDEIVATLIFTKKGLV